MRRVFSLAAVSFVVAAAIACGSEETSSTPSPADASTDVERTDGAAPAPDGGFCCPPDPGPGCCMKYGGFSETGSCFAAICDGMPVPSTPGWALVDDEHGCKVWSQPSGGAKCCQAIIPDAGNDASDASTD